MLVLLTVVESLYLFYMFFLFKTKRCFGPSFLDLQSHSSFFVHDTGVFENKVCLFGKIMALIAIFLAFLRTFVKDRSYLVKGTIVFDSICIIMAAFMNLNALIYIIPLVILETILVNTL